MHLKITKNNKGFSLIELMIATAMFVIIIGLVANNYIQQEGQNVTQNQVVEIQQNVRAGFDMIIKEIRMAGYDPYETYGAGISAAGTGANGSPLIFTYVADSDTLDNDGDGTIDETGELKTVTINLFDSSIDSGNTLDEIQISAAGQPIAENIAALLFTYFDENNNAPPSNNAIRSIQVSLTARADETERNLIGSNRTLVARVKCRNLGL